MTFDGGNYTITYEGDTAWKGLFEVNSSSDFTLQNTQFNLASGGLKNKYGCFFHSTGISMGNKTINVINCSSVTSNPYNPDKIVECLFQTMQEVYSEMIVLITELLI